MNVYFVQNRYINGYMVTNHVNQRD